jgi:hypothetical protein
MADSAHQTIDVVQPPTAAAPVTDGGISEAATGGDARRDRLLVALALVPLAVSAVTLTIHRDRYFPTGDLATSELIVRDIGHHPVLYGLWSRSNWSHPGPMLWYLLWPLYRLTGSTGAGLALAALVINGVAIAGIAYLARRRGGTPLLVISLLGCALLVRTLGAGFVGNYWNLYITTLPFALLLFLVWSLACGDRWALPATGVVATFLVQTHVGFVPLAVALVACGLAYVALDVVRGDGPVRDQARPFVRAAAVSVGLLAVLWLPPAIDMVVNSPSNARRIFEWFKAGDDGTHPLIEGWRVISGQFGAKPEWLAGKLPATYPFAESPFSISAPAPVWLAGLVVAGVVLWRWSPMSGRRLVTTLVVALAASVLAIARTVGVVSDYRLRWTWVVPMVGAIAMAWAAWLAVERRRPGVARRWVLPALAVALAVVTAADAVAAARAPVLEPADSAIMRQLTPPVLQELRRRGVSGHDEILVSDPYTTAAWFSYGLVLQLDHHGYDARVPADRKWQFPAHRVTSGHAELELRVVRDSLALDMLHKPNVQLVALWSTVPLDAHGTRVLRSTFSSYDEIGQDYARHHFHVGKLRDQVAALNRRAPARGAMGMWVVGVYLIRRHPPD